MINPIQCAAFLIVCLLCSCSPKEKAPTDLTTATPVRAVPTIEALENDPDIIWMAELKLDYAPNYEKWAATEEEEQSMKKIGFQQTNRFKVLKHQVTDVDKWEDDDHVLINRILNHRDQITFYKDAALTEVFSKEAVTKMISRVDTFMGVNPTTGASEKMVVVNDLNPDDIKSFRVKQVVYYSKKDMMFYAIPQAVAPLLAEMKDDGTLTGKLTTLFWMPITAKTIAEDLNQASLSWAKRMYRNFEVSNVKPIKGDIEFSALIDLMMADFRANASSITVHNTLDSDGEMKMQPEELETLGARVDTIITFDPATMAETTEVKLVKLDGKNIHQLRLIQDWYWNEATASLAMRYVGFAPIIHRYDEGGYFLNSGPVLVRRVDEI